MKEAAKDEGCGEQRLLEQVSREGGGYGGHDLRGEIGESGNLGLLIWIGHRNYVRLAERKRSTLGEHADVIDDPGPSECRGNGQWN